MRTCNDCVTMFSVIRSGIGFVLLATAALFSGAGAARAQTFDLEKDRVQMTELRGLWRFHTGDDPDGKLGWATPDFDDASWTLLRSDQPWGEQGFKGYRGFAWYRFKVVAPVQQERLAICIPRLLTSYEIFADGKLIGSFGALPPQQPGSVIGFDQIFALPPAISQPGHPISIAIRVWHSSSLTSSGGGPEDAPSIGDLATIQGLKTDNEYGRFWSITSGNVLMLMNLVAAFGGFFLFYMRPSDREYLWFAIYELLTGADHLCTDWAMFYPTDRGEIRLLSFALSGPSWLFFLFFVFRIFNGRRNWLYWAAIATEVATLLGILALQAEWITERQFRIAWAVFLIPYFACVLGLLYRSARQGIADAKMMIIPVAACYASWFAGIFLGLFYFAGASWVNHYFGWYFELSRWPFPFSFENVTDLLMLLAVMAVLPLRFAQSRRDEERLAGELESARTIQQVLIPAETPSVPGVDIRCVYKPAGQVGGDFFQIIPLPNGGLLAVIGDVSGKGMPAAMTVSLLVGTVRTLAHFTQSPGEMLSAMNQRMLGRTNGGFTTCLVLRLDPEGSMTAANAGHLSPYRNGVELEIESGLPLGLSADSHYPEAKFALDPSDQLTLVTDGVVEARAKDGELFGFPRTQAISIQNADQIAQTAQDFGQDDDITVLTLTFAGVPASA